MQGEKVFRLGWRHNKWLVVMPSDTPTDARRAIPIILKRLNASVGNPITDWDHFEFLGESLLPPGDES